MTWHNLRQQMEKPAGRPNLCLADFVAPKASGLKDYLGAFAVTAGIGDRRARQGLRGRPRRLHRPSCSRRWPTACRSLRRAAAPARAQRNSGAMPARKRSANDDLIAEKYQGIRPAPGYPACPEHSEKAPLFELLHATAQIGVISDRKLRHVARRRGIGLLLLATREASISPWRKSSRDQVEDYARRKGWTLADSGALAGAEPGLPARLSLNGRALPALLQHLLQPEQRDHGLGFADLSAAQPVHRIGERHPQDFQEFVVVAAMVAFREAPRQIESQPLVRVADGRVDGGTYATRRRCSRFPLPVRAARRSDHPRRGRSCQPALQ